MFRKIVIVLAAVISWSTTAQELLRNGDFSQGLKYWKINTPKQATIEEKVSPGGKNAMKVVSLKSHYGANYSIAGKKVKPNTLYTVRGKIKTEGNAQVYLYFCQSPGADKHHSRSQVFRKTTGWTDVYCLLNSGNAKELPLLTRVIGTGTAWFAELSIMEGNHIPVENLFLNSDFKLRTRYKELPDNWGLDVQTGIAAAEYFACRPGKAAPPVAGAGVLEVKNGLLEGNLIQRPVPGLTYTYSFYAKKLDPKVPVELRIRLDVSKKQVKLTDRWQRYSITGKVTQEWPVVNTGAIQYDAAFLFSAPQLVPGNAPLPWQTPKAAAKAVVTNIKEAVAEADCRRIAGEPKESDWKSADIYPIGQITKGVPAGIFRSKVRILQNGQFVFIRFEGESDPAIKVGDRTRLTWGSLCDTFELFMTDTALDGTFIQYAVNINGHDYSARNMNVEVLGITSKVTRNASGWRADIKVPLKLFRANRNWKIAFCRCYDHVRYGRMALDWSLPGSRHNTAKFGILKGVSVTPVASLELEKLYGDIDGKSLCYEFSGVKKEMLGGKLTASIVQNGKTLWSSSQSFTKNSGKIALPANYRAMMNSTTRIALNVTGTNGKNYYQASRVLYLMFSSYAKLNRAMTVYPKYNLFTEKDKTVDLQVELDKSKYDRLRITLLDGKGKAAYRAETTGVLAVPSGKLGFGRYKIQVEALKNGKVADIRCHETFEKLPFRPEMVRLNRLVNCLADAKGNFIPMLYYPGSSSAGTLDRGFFGNRKVMNHHARLAGYNGVKSVYPLGWAGRLDEYLKNAEEQDMPLLVDMEQWFPRGYYSHSNKMSGPETEKVMIGSVNDFQKRCFGRRGILSYAPYHEPGYFRGGRGIVDSYRVAEILPELRKGDPYRPITGFWAPPHWDANGEPFGTVDGVDYFIVDIYTRDLKKHCDELFRVAKASRLVRRPLGQIFNIDNLGQEDRECPMPAEYRAEVYAALIAGYRVFFNFVGLPAARETWHEMKKINHELPVIAGFICDDQCRELASVNEENVCYAVYRKGKEVMVMASSKSNDSKVRFSIDLKKLCRFDSVLGKALFGPEKVQVKNGIFEYILPPAGSGIWVFNGQ